MGSNQLGKFIYDRMGGIYGVSKQAEKSVKQRPKKSIENNRTIVKPRKGIYLKKKRKGKRT